MMKEDDAAELIAKSADTTLGVIGGEFGCYSSGFGCFRVNLDVIHLLLGVSG